jgi:hypothetical protein
MLTPLCLFQACDSHFLLIAIHTQLPKVIHTTAIQITFVSLEEAESASTNDFVNPVLLKAFDLLRLMYFTLLHSNARFK